MKKIDVGQTITILANVGVIAGIAFLAIEINQNNSQLAAQGRNAVYQMQSDLQRDYINNVGGIADVWTKAILGEDVSHSERLRMYSSMVHWVRTFEYMFQEDRQGALQSVAFMASVFSYPGLQSYWGDTKGDRNPEFVEFVEKIVIPQTISLDQLRAF